MENRMKFRNKIAYGLGDFGSNYCWTFISSFALIYFTNTVGVSAAAVGTLMLVARILDGFTDVMMGGLIDRTKSRMGKARPWLFWSTFPLAIAMIMLFNVPAGFSGTGKIIYILIIYTLLGAFFYTASNISYNALVSLATDNPKERVSMGSIRFICAVLAGLTLMSTTMGLVDAFGTGQRGWAAVSILYALVFTGFTLITVFGVKEMKKKDGADIPVAEKKNTSNGLTFGRSMVLLVKNKYFLIMLGIYLANYIGSGLGGVGVYFATYVLGNSALLGTLSMAGIVPMIFILPLTPKLTGKMGMQKACFIGSLIGIGGSVIVVLSNGFLPVLMIGLVIRSAGSAPLIGTMYALVAEIAEYAFLKFKTRMDGTIHEKRSGDQRHGGIVFLCGHCGLQLHGFPVRKRPHFVSQPDHLRIGNSTQGHCFKLETGGKIFPRDR